MKIMDCTLRDGANVLGNGFPRELTEMMLRSVYKELHADHETGAADNK